MTVLDPGTRVRVRMDWPETRGPAHVRTPHYLRGQSGVVRRYLGSFANPEDLAFGRPAALLPLYHLSFDARGLWPDEVTADQIIVEIFGSWLDVEEAG